MKKNSPKINQQQSSFVHILKLYSGNEILDLRNKQENFQQTGTIVIMYKENIRKN